MHNQNNSDISNIEVPQSFIQEILAQTEPLKEGRQEIHPTQPQAAQVSEEGEVTKLLSLLFEEFDKLNSRLDELQTSINEMGTTTGHGMATGPMPMGKPLPQSSKRKLERGFADLLKRRG